MSTLRVFINYRREDTAGHAGRLYDALAEQFGEDSVFMDINAIEPGMDFGKVVDNTLGTCDVLVALIGAGEVEGRVRERDDEDPWVIADTEGKCLAV